MKATLFLFSFFIVLFSNGNINGQSDNWRLDAVECGVDLFHCCCYNPNGIYVGCQNCEVKAYQITCNYGGIFYCDPWLSGCQAGGLTAEECQNCCFPGIAGGVNPDHPNAPLPFGMI